MDTAKLKKMIDLVRESGIAELEISEGTEKIRITNINQPVMMSAMPTQHYSTQIPNISQNYNPNSPSNNQQTNTPPPPTPVVDTTKIIKSPMVGTFYRASAPGAKPLVEVGSKIKKGDVLCIIEAMKLMNEIESEQDGVIKEILATNEQPVEYGEPLFILE